MVLSLAIINRIEGMFSGKAGNDSTWNSRQARHFIHYFIWSFFIPLQNLGVCNVQYGRAKYF